MLKMAEDANLTVSAAADFLTFSIKLKQKEPERHQAPAASFKKPKGSNSKGALMLLHTSGSLLLCSAHVRGYSLCFPPGRTCQAESTSGRRGCCAALTPEAPNAFTS